MAVSSTQIPVEEQKTCPHFHLLYSVIKKEATETELRMYNKQMVAVRRKAAFVQGFAMGQCSHISVQIVRLKRNTTYKCSRKQFNGTILSMISVYINTAFHIQHILYSPYTTWKALSVGLLEIIKQHIEFVIIFMVHFHIKFYTHLASMFR